MERPSPSGDSNKVTYGGLACARRLRVLAGCLAGFQGTSIERRGASRVLMALDELKHGVFVEVDEAHLEPVDEHFDQDS